jgi:hypothetical protein
VTRRVALPAALALLAAPAVARAQAAPPAPTAVAVGDWQVAPVAGLRVRGEYRRDLEDQNQGMLLERARLGVDAQSGAVEARVVLQDARALDLGGGPDPVAGPAPVAATGAYEAWVDAHAGAGGASFVRVGRQALRWGEGRLLGTADWSPTGRSLDAVRGRLVVGDGAFELLGVILMDSPVGASLDTYGELAGARAEWAFDPLFAAEAYVLARVAHATPPASLGGSVRGETYTGALRLHGDAYAWAWAAEGAYQLGHAADLGVGRAAFGVAGHVGRAFEHVVSRPGVRLGAAYASGDDGRGTYRGFDPLLPDVHVWHGAMDLFAWSNEVEASARATMTPWTDAGAAVEYRYARLATPGGPWISGNLVTIGSAAGNTKAELGHEVDASLRWSPWTPLELAAGYSFLVLGDGARAILAANAIGTPQGGVLRGPSVAHFAFAEVTLALP